MRRILIGFIAAGVIVACSSPDIGDPPAIEKPVVKKKKDAGADDTTTPTTTPTTPTSTKNACAAETSSNGCWGCCQEQFPFEADILTPVTDCDCQKCATQCADTFCNLLHIAPTDGDACDVCLKANQDTCDAAGEAACNADAKCKKFADCGKSAGCEAKP